LAETIISREELEKQYVIASPSGDERKKLPRHKNENSVEEKIHCQQVKENSKRFFSHFFLPFQPFIYFDAFFLEFNRKVFEGVYDRQQILGWLKFFYTRFFSNQFKRFCLPDGSKVSPAALSLRGAWHMPSDASACPMDGYPELSGMN
jgi:hypothetical protein